MTENKRVTIYDIAKEVNVSVGTVNRALHNKPRISASTKAKVLETAKRMNYKVNAAAQGLRRNPVYMGVILDCPFTQYRDDIQRGIEHAFAQLAEYNVYGDIRVIAKASDNTKQIEAALDDFEQKEYQCVIWFPHSQNADQQAKLNRMRQKGVIVGTVVSELANVQSDITVGTHGICAGRLAAEFLYLCCGSGKVAVMIGSRKSSIHKQNLLGFTEYAKQHPFEQVIVCEHRDDEKLAEEKTRTLLKEHPDLAGIYNATAISPIIGETVLACGYAGKIKIIATDLLSQTKAFMRDGVFHAVIFQNPFRQGEEIVERMYQRVCLKQGVENCLVQPALILTSNMDL